MCVFVLYLSCTNNKAKIMKTLTTTTAEVFKPKNALEKTLFNRFMDAVNIWKEAFDKNGLTEDVDKLRIEADRHEWIFKMQCPFSSCNTLQIKRDLNLIQY